jgi:hypothetical protein
LHVIRYIGKQRVAEVSRETIHRLLTVVLKEEGASQTTILHTRTALSAMKDQFLHVHNAVPRQPAKVLARFGVSSGARLCELISFIPGDFDFAADMLAVRRSTVEVTAKYHPTGDRFSRGSTPRTASIAGSTSIMRSQKWCGSTSRFTESGPAR